MRDLNSLNVVERANEGFDLRLYDPTTLEDLGIVIRILGRDSTEYNKVFAEQNRKRMAKISKGSFRSAAISVEELERDAIQMLAACTKGWRSEESPGSKDAKPILLLKGEELVCTAENAVRVYSEFPWIKEQVDAGIGDRANFTKR